MDDGAPCRPVILECLNVREKIIPEGAKHEKSCTILFFEGYISIAPTLINLIRALVREGFQVNLHTLASDYIPFTALPKGCSLFTISSGYERVLTKHFYRFLQTLRLTSLVPVLELFIFAIQSLKLDRSDENRIGEQKPLTVGIDSRGSAAAQIRSWFRRDKTVYLSLELVPSGAFRRFARIIPWLERRALKRSAAIIIQDEERYSTLSTYHSTARHPRVFLLLNAPYGETTDEIREPTRDFFREKFKLDAKEFPYIVLQAGFIDDQVYSKELAQSFSTMDGKYAFVFHERETRAPDDPYIQSLRELNSTNLFLSLDPLPFEEIDRVYSSATIGLAFYRDTNPNIGQIAKASGKLAFYLKHGLPVLVNNLPSLERLIRKFKFGEVITDPTDPEEISSALDRIIDNYDLFSENAKECFSKEFDFEKHVEPLVAFMDSI